MNTDPKKSAQPCGCDEGANHMCKECQTRYLALDEKFVPGTPWVEVKRGLFPDSAQGRKDHPMFTGVLMYFPDAIAAVAHVSKLGNDQHNPGQPLHWARGKSTDQTDTAVRHMMDHGVGNIKDTDGTYHMAKAAWRCLAELQLTIEKERESR